MFLYLCLLSLVTIVQCANYQSPITAPFEFQKNDQLQYLFIIVVQNHLFCIFSIYYSGCNGDFAIYHSSGNFVSFNGGGFFILTSNPHSQILYARNSGGVRWTSTTTKSTSRCV